MKYLNGLGGLVLLIFWNMLVGLGFLDSEASDDGNIEYLD
jgi:hypothetical protein